MKKNSILSEQRNFQAAIEIRKVPGISANPTLRGKRHDTDLQDLIVDIAKDKVK